MTSLRRSKNVFTTYFRLSLLLSYFYVAFSEIRVFNGAISATSSFVHFSEGYILAPGFVDLSNLVFLADNATTSTYETLEFNDDSNDDKHVPDEVRRGEDDDDVEDREKEDAANTPTTAPVGATNEPPAAAPVQPPVEDREKEDAANTPTTAPVGARNEPPAAAPVQPPVEDVATKISVSSLVSPTVKVVPTRTPVAAPVEPPSKVVEATGAPVAAGAKAGKGGTNDIRRQLDGADPSSSVVDIVFFHEPAECSNSLNGCDWTKIGVGASDEVGNLRWCCSDDAIALGFCNKNNNQYKRLIINEETFQGEHRMVSIPSNGDVDESIQYGKIVVKESGTYTLVVANCDDDGRNLILTGSYTWKSKDGYLPGDLFGKWYFYTLVALLYAVVFTWYGISMRCNKASTISIQKWILITIGLGVLETSFISMDHWIWNKGGTRAWYFMYTGVIIGVLKRSISRCLVVMVSLGWGVVRDTLGDQLRNIIILGVMYCGVATARDIMSTFVVNELQKLTTDQEVNLFDAVNILNFVVVAIDVTFFMWILDALNGTMQYLENMNQRMKLKRYLRLRLILLFSILFAVVWAVFSVVDTYMDTSLLQEGQDWVVQAAWELNYILVLLSVACLWRPNPNAKDYAFVMELSASGNDIELETNADTMDDEENHSGYEDSPRSEEGLKIDDAVKA